MPLFHKMQSLKLLPEHGPCLDATNMQPWATVMKQGAELGINKLNN